MNDKASQYVWILKEFGVHEAVYRDTPCRSCEREPVLKYLGEAKPGEEVQVFDSEEGEWRTVSVTSMTRTTFVVTVHHEVTASAHQLEKSIKDSLTPRGTSNLIFVAEVELSLVQPPRVCPKCGGAMEDYPSDPGVFYCTQRCNGGCAAAEPPKVG